MATVEWGKEYKLLQQWCQVINITRLLNTKPHKLQGKTGSQSYKLTTQIFM